MNAHGRTERGQATVLTLVFLVVLLGMAALVLDIGSWYRADRATALSGGTFGASFGFVAPGAYVVDIVQPSGLTGHTIDPAVPFPFTAVVGPPTTLAFTVK